MNLLGISIKKTRHVFFSFHYADIMRVNNVRLSGEFKTDKTDGRSIEGFYDRSLWESRRLTGDEALKNLIREGVQRTSVVCVLAGTDTWRRRWVRYEIARAVIDGKGLLAIHINGINHHERKVPDPRSENPCFYMGIALSKNGKYYLCERKSIDGTYTWEWYKDYTFPVPIPKFMKSPPLLGQPVRLSKTTFEYDWVQQQGHKNIGWWCDLAAQEAGYS